MLSCIILALPCGSKHYNRRARHNRADHRKDMSQHDPIALFRHHLHARIAQGDVYANAVALTTQNEHNDPDIRVVLIKEIDSGFVFYTNYSSHKGQQLAQQAIATLSSLWPGDPYIVITGRTQKVDEAQSDRYFASRPRLSQISAIASPQSQPISSRKALMACVEKVTRQYRHQPPLRPSYWGGYRVVPEYLFYYYTAPNALRYEVEYYYDGRSWSCQKTAVSVCSQPSVGDSPENAPKDC